MARKTGGRIKAVVFLALSMAAGTVATVVVGAVLWSLDTALTEALTAPQQAMVRVPMPDRVVQRGESLTMDDLALVEVPQDYLPEGVAWTAEEVVGRVPRERLLPHEPVRVERLAPPGSEDGLSTLVPRGMRAVSVVLDDDARVSGFVEPGNRVDVVVSTEGDGPERVQTRTVLHALEVLAVSTPGEKGRRGKPQVVLQANPEEVEQVSHALEEGHVKLALRSDIDLNLPPEAERVTTTSSLLGAPEQRMAITEWVELRASNPHILTVIQGPSSQRVEVSR